MPDFCQDHTAHQQALDRSDRRLNSYSEKIDAMQVAIQKLTDIQGQNTALVTDLERRVSSLEDQPVKAIQRIKDAALAALGGALGTGMIALVVLALINSIYA